MAGPVLWRACLEAEGRLGLGGGVAKSVADLEPASGPCVVHHCAPLRRRRPGGRGVSGLLRHDPHEVADGSTNQTMKMRMTSQTTVTTFV